MPTHDEEGKVVITEAEEPLCPCITHPEGPGCPEGIDVAKTSCQIAVRDEQSVSAELSQGGTSVAHPFFYDIFTNVNDNGEPIVIAKFETVTERPFRIVSHAPDCDKSLDNNGLCFGMKAPAGVKMARTPRLNRVTYCEEQYRPEERLACRPGICVTTDSSDSGSFSSKNNACSRNDGDRQSCISDTGNNCYWTYEPKQSHCKEAWKLMFYPTPSSAKQCDVDGEYLLRLQAYGTDNPMCMDSGSGAPCPPGTSEGPTGHFRDLRRRVMIMFDLKAPDHCTKNLGDITIHNEITTYIPPEEASCLEPTTYETCLWGTNEFRLCDSKTDTFAVGDTVLALLDLSSYSAKIKASQVLSITVSRGPENSQNCNPNGISRNLCNVLRFTSTRANIRMSETIAISCCGRRKTSQQPVRPRRNSDSFYIQTISTKRQELRPK